MGANRLDSHQVHGCSCGGACARGGTGGCGVGKAMRFLSLVAAVLAVVALVGCAKSKPPIKLPPGTHWVGDRIWVPYGEAQAMAPVICNQVATADESGWQPWSRVVTRDGELLICEDGVRER